MRKRIIIAWILLCSILITGCGKKTVAPDQNEQETADEYETYAEDEHRPEILKKAVVKCETTTWIIEDVITDGIWVSGIATNIEEEKYRNQIKSIDYKVNGTNMKKRGTTYGPTQNRIDPYTAQFFFEFYLDERVEDIIDKSEAELVFTNLFGNCASVKLEVGKAIRRTFDYGAADGMISPLGIIIEGKKEDVPDAETIVVITEGIQKIYRPEYSCRQGFTWDLYGMYSRFAFKWEEILDIDKIDKVLFDGMEVYSR